jgi:hypothetical protein
MKKAIIRRRSDWRVGERERRKDTNDQGTIAETNNKIKIKWDSGATSYFEREKPGNVRLIKPNP